MKKITTFVMIGQLVLPGSNLSAGEITDKLSCDSYINTIENMSYSQNLSDVEREKLEIVVREIETL